MFSDLICESHISDFWFEFHVYVQFNKNNEEQPAY